MKLSEEQITAALGPDLWGRTCVDRAVEALRQFEPPEGYFLAFSGGKDSITIKQLAIEAGVKFEAHYHMTTVDPPEVVQYIRKHHPDVVMDRPKRTMWELIEKRGLPSRTRRWCCAELKERHGHGRFIITGIRGSESVRRAARAKNSGGYTEVCMKDPSKRFLNPIINWTEDQVWAFIQNRGMPYCCLYDEGFTRIGCVICPMEMHPEMQMERWPKLWAAAERAALRYWSTHDSVQKIWRTGESFWAWWCDRDAPAPDDDPECIGLFSAGMEG